MEKIIKEKNFHVCCCQAQDLIVVGGITNLTEKNGARLKIDRIFKKKPTGQKEVHDNIALLRLTKKIDYDVTYPVKFEHVNHNAAEEGGRGEVYGWGQKYVSGQTNTLQMAEATISKLSECKQFNSDVDESNLCTHDDKARLCDGDTGNFFHLPFICDKRNSNHYWCVHIGNPLVSSRGIYLWGIATEQHSVILIPELLLSQTFTNLFFRFQFQCWGSMLDQYK